MITPPLHIYPEMTYPPQPPILRLPSNSSRILSSRTHLNAHLHVYFLLTMLRLQNDDHISFLALRQTCKSLRQQSEAILFKRLEFRGASEENGLLARLHDANDGLAAHVNTLELA
jgi:hypothetical protein